MKNKLNVDQAKSIVRELLGKNVNIALNHGRNKISHFKGVLSEMHSNVFVVRLADDIFDRISCSYTDLVCGELVIRPQV